MGHSYLANRAVTDEGSKAKYISNDSLIVRLSEHKRHKLAYPCEEHHDIRCSLSLISEAAIVGLNEAFSHMERYISLSHNAT